MSEEQREIISLVFCSLFADGTMGFSGGVGFVGSEDREEVRKLYEAMKTIFEAE